MKSKKLYKIAFLSCMTILMCLFCVNAQSQQNVDQNIKEPELGRTDPFAQLPGINKQPVTQEIPVPIKTTLNIPELFVQTMMLKFLDATSLKQAIDNMSSEYGSIAVNEKNNSLIICDTKDNLEKIMSEILKADKTPHQIMIEVVILDVQLNDDKEIGLNWDILSTERYDISYRQNFTVSRLGSTIEDATTIGDASAFNTTGFGGSFSVISGTIRNVVHLIQQKRDVEILASPRVMMVSGQSASIEAVEELPYTEIMDAAAGGAAALTTTRFKNVGVQLTVEATLTDSNDIFLIVEAEQNVATGQSDTEVPIVDTRRANTSLLLKDGQVVVFGGLRRQEKTREVDQIPILGDLPIVGFLFKSTNIISKNSELIVFLSPHIYRGEPVPEDAMSKYRQITNKPLLTFPEDTKPKTNRNQSIGPDTEDEKLIEYKL
jgi:type II secretory pathway component GspD/PulD (secretin)